MKKLPFTPTVKDVPNSSGTKQPIAFKIMNLWTKLMFYFFLTLSFTIMGGVILLTAEIWRRLLIFWWDQISQVDVVFPSLLP
jgi:hypothetical protein